jgi:uncharacterized repeat protein (TIGR03806 family)
LLAALLTACGPSLNRGPNLSVILAEDPAPTLSAYGFFKDASAREPAQGVTPYDLANPLFSDHATKHRLVFTPEGEAAPYNASKVFDFPVGSVLIKTFAFAPDMRDPATDERYIETRLLIRKADGWAAYPYIWNAEQTEATYAPVGGKQTIQTIAPDGEAITIAYAIPNRNQCKTCHSVGDELIPIGPAARHLNHAGPTGENQIAAWTAAGHLTGAPADASAIPAAPHAFDVSASLEVRARAWLDINCAHCHRADASASNSGLFLAWDETNPTGWGVRKRPVAAGRGAGDNLFVIDPAAPDKSILVHRLESTEAGVMMPELGRTQIDGEGLGLIRQWIAAMPAQP